MSWIPEFATACAVLATAAVNLLAWMLRLRAAPAGSRAAVRRHARCAGRCYSLALLVAAVLAGVTIVRWMSDAGIGGGVVEGTAARDPGAVPFLSFYGLCVAGIAVLTLAQSMSRRVSPEGRATA